MDLAAAARSSTPTRPNRVAAAIDRVIVRDFLAWRDLPQGEYQPFAAGRLDVGIRIAGMVDMPFRRLHKDHAAAGQVIAVAGIIPGAERMELIDDAGIVNGENRFTGNQGLCGKHTEPLDGRESN